MIPLPDVRISAAPAKARLPLAGPEGNSFIHLVDSGLVRPVAIAPDGRELGLGVLGPGECFLHHDEHPLAAIGFYAEAATDCRYVSIARPALANLGARSPELAGRLLVALAGRVADLSVLAASLCLESAADRLLRILRQLALRQGSAEGDTIRLRVRQQDIAAASGLCRETVNAALRSLAGSGAIRVGRGSVWLLPQGSAAGAGLGQRAVAGR